MTRRKKKSHEDEHVDESWLLPYADLLTLLVALFIVLFASSAIDVQKFQKMSTAFNEVFSGGNGVIDFPSPMPEGSMAPQKKESVSASQLSGLSDEEQDTEELKKLKAKVDHYIISNDITDKFETELTTEGLLVTIRDNVLFSSGSAEVRARDIQTAEEISELLVMNPPRNIIISGHTDNVPIRNANFESNWELSVMRAVNFMKVLLHNPELNPEWFSAKGFGEYKPKESNETVTGRERNRRVEILILPRELTTNR
ncbi:MULTISPECIES: flagellar motor protein MotB [Cytobacillus]|uniref:flagellar motor protein MotB n=1 Tax=Cytobacillus TaxID=2675230 RepID=UPI0025A1FB50|nr:flagellar motor protein MotB [Cytobacillus kochii]MDM5206669.1 flagellar motor protein MotB [Cytobacillus kochii]